MPAAAMALVGMLIWSAIPQTIRVRGPGSGFQITIGPDQAPISDADLGGAPGHRPSKSRGDLQDD